MSSRAQAWHRHGFKELGADDPMKLASGDCLGHCTEGPCRRLRSGLTTPPGEWDAGDVRTWHRTAPLPGCKEPSTWQGGDPQDNESCDLRFFS